jgi:hypothetical protein
MEQSPWEANSHSSNQEIRSILRNPKLQYRVHISPPLVPILSKEFVQVRGPVGHFLTYQFLRWGFVSFRPTLQAGKQPLFGCLQPPMQYIRS